MPASAKPLRLMTLCTIFVVGTWWIAYFAFVLNGDHFGRTWVRPVVKDVPRHARESVLVDLHESTWTPNNFFHPVVVVTVMWASFFLIRRRYPNADFTLLICAFTLNGIGLVLIYRIAPVVTIQQAQPGFASLEHKQTLLSIFGIIVMTASVYLATQQRLRRLARWGSFFIFLAMLLIPLTAIFGTTINGRRLWIRIGPFSMETVEVVKVFAVLYIASFADREALYIIPSRKLLGIKVPYKKYLLPYFFWMVLLIGSVCGMREFGSAVILFLLFSAMLFLMSGYFFISALKVMIVPLAGFGAYSFVGVVQTRLDMVRDVFTRSEQMTHCRWVIAQTGFWGQTIGNGIACKTIPVAHSDFLPAVVLDELGLIGALGMMLLIFLFCTQLFRTAFLALNTFERYLCLGLGFSFAAQSLIIIGYNTGLTPIMGLPLGFVSAGGSSLLCLYALLGVAIAISGRNDDQSKVWKSHKQPSEMKD